MEKKRSQIAEVINSILATEWDPIGIKDDPIAASEYLSYAHAIVHLLGTGCDAGALSLALQAFEQNELGLAPNISVDDTVARKLVATYRRLAS
jgi:hypothetical protein